MRIIRFKDKANKIQLAQDIGGGQVERLEGPWFESDPSLTPTGEIIPFPGQLLAPLDPPNILCIGLNYAEHAKEGGHEPPSRPVVFAKLTSALNDPGRPIRIPKCQLEGPEVDYECELAVVIGRSARNVSQEDALKYVFGYCCANDVSARRWQSSGGGGQWVRGKGFDSFCPLGPCLVTADEIDDPQNLAITTTLNGQVMQDSNTGDMIFSVKDIIAFLSQDTTLLPGTVILTGTPQGVGFARTPPVWLKAGDEVTVEVEGIGRLVNPVEA